ncbi:MAG: phosphotransferase [Syntrophales bacterium]|nr:phosphotransferase [Syntrophales bacterium]
MRDVLLSLFSISSDEPLSLEELNWGGSDRFFFRVEWSWGSVVVIRYNKDVEENSLYEAQSEILRLLGVPVPRVFYHDKQSGLLVVEDVGRHSLYDFRDGSWEELCELYRRSLRAIYPLHTLSGGSLAERLSACSMPPFDEDLYIWERSYFLERFVKGVCGIDLSSEEIRHFEEETREISSCILNGPSGYVHRDFQSQNILIKDGKPHFVDFQGLRWGNPLYDVASILYDPYVSIDDGRRLELLRFYYNLIRDGIHWDDFYYTFLSAAAQRLMQALGAFGFLGTVKGKRIFLTYIPRALEYLGAVAEKLGTLKNLSSLLMHCREAVAF